MPFENNQRITRRRSSAGPTPPKRPTGNNLDLSGRQNQGPRPTFLTLRDHGKVFVADLPNLSDGQLAHISKEANEVLNSLEKRLNDLENEPNISNPEKSEVVDEPKETVKIMDIPSSNTNASLVVSIDSNKNTNEN